MPTLTTDTADALRSAIALWASSPNPCVATADNVADILCDVLLPEDCPEAPAARVGFFVAVAIITRAGRVPPASRLAAVRALGVMPDRWLSIRHGIAEKVLHDWRRRLGVDTAAARALDIAAERAARTTPRPPGWPS